MSLVFKRESAYGPVVLEKLGEDGAVIGVAPAGVQGGASENGQKEGKRIDTSTLPMDVGSMDVVSARPSQGLSSSSLQLKREDENIIISGNKSLKRRLDGKRPEPVQTQVREWQKPPVSGTGVSSSSLGVGTPSRHSTRRRASLADGMKTSHLKSQATTAAQRYRIRNRRHSINTTVKRIHMDTIDLSFENELLENSFVKKNAQMVQNSLLFVVSIYVLLAISVLLPCFATGKGSTVLAIVLGAAGGVTSCLVLVFAHMEGWWEHNRNIISALLLLAGFLLLLEGAAVSNFEVGSSNVGLYAFYILGVSFSWPRFNMNSWICSLLTVVEIVLIFILRPSDRDVSLAVVDAVLALTFFAFAIYATRQSDWNNRHSFLIQGLLSAENKGVKMELKTAMSWSRGLKIGGADGDMTSEGGQNKMDAAHMGIYIQPDELEMLGIIGAGAFASVIKARWKGTLVAVKKMKVTGTSEEDSVSQFAMEARMLAELRHPNIVMFMGVCLMYDFAALVMEFCAKGSLAKILTSSKKQLDGKDAITTKMILFFLTDASRGMYFLHSQDPEVHHHDLKSHNLLVDDTWRCKVSDFGLAELNRRHKKRLKAEKRKAKKSTKQMRGLMNRNTPSPTSPLSPGAGIRRRSSRFDETAMSVGWAAPEILSGKHFRASADVYSFAVVIYECLSRKRPYEGAALFSIPHAVANGARPSDRHLDIGVSAEENLDVSTSKSEAQVGDQKSFKPIKETSYEKDSDGKEVHVKDVGNERKRDLGEGAEYNPTSDLLSQSLQHRNAEAKLKLCGSQYGGNEDSMVKGDLFDIMVKCWAHDPKDRPEFKDILRRLESLTEKFFGEKGESDFNRDPIGKGLGQASTVNGPRSRKQSSVRQEHDFDISQIQIGPLIGTGASGEVYLGNLHGTAVAVKRIVIENMSEEETLSFEKECRLVQTLRHPNVVLFMGTCMDGESTLIVTELMEYGDLHQIYSETPRQESDVEMLQFALSLGSHVARGGSYIHSFKPPIIHRDMKSSNILLNEQRVAKISDFGLSRTKAKDATMTRCGSPLWCAPEILKGVHFDEKCDVYGYAIILWEALAWKEPWVGVKMMQVINNVTNGKRPKIPAYVPEPIMELIKRCWAQDPKERPSFKEVVVYLEEHENILEFDGDNELSEAVLTNIGMHPAVQEVQNSMKVDTSIQPGLAMQKASFGASTMPLPSLQPPQNTKSSVEAMILQGAEFGDGSNDPKGQALASAATYQNTLLRTESVKANSKSSQNPGGVAVRQDSFYSRSLINETIAGNEIIHVGGAVQTSVSGLLTSVLSPSVSTRSKGKGTEWSRSAKVAAADQLGPSTIKAEAAKKRLQTKQQ